MVSTSSSAILRMLLSPSSTTWITCVSLAVSRLHIGGITPRLTAYTTCDQKCSHLLLLLHPFNGLFSRTTWVSRYQKGKTSLDYEARDYGVLGRQWHHLDHMQTICTSLQTDNHTNTSSLNFYRPDALPDAQPTVSKYWRTMFTLKVK